MDEKPIEQMGLNEIHEAARLMPAEAWEYVMGAADSGATMERNVAAFKKFLFQERIFHQVTDPDTSVTVFGPDRSDARVGCSDRQFLQD